MYGAVLFLCAVAASGASLVEYQEWPAAVSHQSRVEVHPSPLAHYAAPAYDAPLVSHYGAYGGHGAYNGGYGAYGGGYGAYGGGYGAYGGGYGAYGGYGGLLGHHGHHLYKRSAHYSPLVVAPHAAVLPIAAPHAVVLPGAVSHQSRVDIHQATPFHYAAPYSAAYGYASPLGYASHIYAPKAYGAYGYHW